VFASFLESKEESNSPSRVVGPAAVKGAPKKTKSISPKRNKEIIRNRTKINFKTKAKTKIKIFMEDKAVISKGIDPTKTRIIPGQREGIGVWIVLGARSLWKISISITLKIVFCVNLLPLIGTFIRLF